MRILLRASESRWLAPAAIVVAVLVTLLLTAGPIRLAGANPLSAYERYVITPLTTFSGLGEMLLASTPLIFTGLSVAIAFRVGYFNIGAEGQFLAGAISATIPALYLPDLPAIFALPLALVSGAVGGMVWAGLAGVAGSGGFAAGGVASVAASASASASLSAVAEGRLFCAHPLAGRVVASIQASAAR